MECRSWRPLYSNILSSYSTGVPYVRAAASTIDIICTTSDNSLSLSFAQNVDDDVGGVIWDCGLLLVDYIIAYMREKRTCEVESSDEFCVLDLGTGTGVAGIVASINGASRCTLTDYKEYPVMRQNLLAHQQHLLWEKCTFEEYSWGEPLPAAWEGVCFDLLLAGDILYDHRSFEALRKSFKLLRFRKMVVTYKRRHDDEEESFLGSLEDTYSIQEVIMADSLLQNFSRIKNKEGMHVLQLVPL